MGGAARGQGQSNVACDIAPVGELPVEHLIVEYRRDLRPDALELSQRADLTVRLAGWFVGFDDGIALGLDGPDQLEQKLQALELSADLVPETVGQRLAVAGAQLVRGSVRWCVPWDP
jgi:hypothetical protein